MVDFFAAEDFFPVRSQNISNLLRIRSDIPPAEDEALGDQESLVCMAVLIYATYNTTNCLRCKGGLAHEGAVEALKQGCRNAVMGHRPSTKVVDSRWTPITT